MDGTAAGGAPLKGYREVYFPERGYVRTAVYDRYHLPAGFTAEGPAVVEERESTVIVYPGDGFQVDAYRNLVVHIGGAAQPALAEQGGAPKREGLPS